MTGVSRGGVDFAEASWKLKGRGGASTESSRSRPLIIGATRYN